MKPRRLPTNISFSIPYEVMIDTRLKLSSRVLYSEILAMSRKHGYCYAANEHFVDMLGISLNTVSRSIKELEEHGYIVVKDANSKKRTIKAINPDKIKPPQNETVEPHQNGEVKKRKRHQNGDVKQPPQNGEVLDTNVPNLVSEPPQNGEATSPNCHQNQIASNYIDNYKGTNNAKALAVASDEVIEIVDVPAAEEPKPDKRNPEINQLIEEFEAKMGLKMPKAHLQRRAAHTLIQQHTYPIVFRAIAAVAACRDEQFAPKILSLVELRDKWNDLIEFYRRNQAKTTPKKVRKAV